MFKPVLSAYKGSRRAHVGGDEGGSGLLVCEALGVGRRAVYEGRAVLAGRAVDEGVEHDARRSSARRTRAAAPARRRSRAANQRLRRRAHRLARGVGGSCDDLAICAPPRSWCWRFL